MVTGREKAGMTTQETVKPLVDRILSNPLHFRKASRAVLDGNQVDMKEQEGSYIMIGRGHRDEEEASKEVKNAVQESQEAPKRVKRVPQSLAEAIGLYSQQEQPQDESLSDVDVNAASGYTGSSSSEEEFHEASEYANGEDLGMAVDMEESGSSSDQEFKADDVPHESDESSEEESSEDSVSRVSDSERVQLQEEAQEAEAIVEKAKEEGEEEGEEEELKHKAPLSQRSVTPPVILGDIQQFYQVGEDINDRGSNGSSRVVKNWGPHLSALRPKGLLNHGVTCYTNAAVQAIVHIPAIQHYLFDILRGKYESTISRDSVSYVLAETSKKMWLPQDRSKKKNGPHHINPKKLIARLDDINCMMSEWQQEDSHEYFMSLMSRLQEDSVPKGHKMTESIIYDIFGGLLKQVVTCKSCGSVSKTEQPFYDLSLHLKGKKKQSLSQDSQSDDQNKSSDAKSDDSAPSRRYSIEKSIRDFFNPELIRVDKEQKGYVCEKCHQTTNAVKRSSIIRAPETLLTHLKKFRFNGTASSKMKQAVSYPMFLDLTEYCESNEKDHVVPVKYQLTTVVVHEGRSLSSGHYIVHCKQPDGTWATYDDEYINKITERDVLKEPNAYYLLYTRLTPKEIETAQVLNVKDLDIPVQMNGSSHATPTSSPVLNKSKKWKKNKKRRFNRY